MENILATIIRNLTVLCLLLPTLNVFAANNRPLLFGMNPISASWINKPAYWEATMYDKVVESGATIVRIGIDWCNIEQTPGVYSWGIYETRINMAYERGLDIIALICTVPGWANETGEPNIYRPLETAADEFIAFCTVLSSRFASKIDKYEFWNEPDVGGWLPAASFEEYTPWLKRCYQGIKAGNPNARVAVGGILGRNMWFLTGIYSLDAKNYFDAVCVHPYANNLIPPPAIDFQQVIDCRNVMVNNGDSAKKIWITEYGWNLKYINQSQQASAMQEALNGFTSDSYPYLEIATHHTIADFDLAGNLIMGLCDTNLNARQAFDTFRNYPKPTRPPTATPITCMKGDVNCDAGVTPGDALLCFQFYLETAVPSMTPCDQSCAADYNSDSSITPGDALCIFKLYMEVPC